ncbi:hypothetical protein ABPG74_019474 [Tetrahymena malaccensis]
MRGGHSSTGQNTIYNTDLKQLYLLKYQYLNRQKNLIEIICYKNIMQERNKTRSMPSIENFCQRLNLFGKKIEKLDVYSDHFIQQKHSLNQNTQNYRSQAQNIIG